MTDALQPSAFALRCGGLCKRFGDTLAVDGLDLDVTAGEILAVLGPSGCGKTTLLRLVAGFEQPDAGWIRIGEHEVFGPQRNVPPERRQVGMVFQDYALFPHLTVAGNVAYGAGVVGSDDDAGGLRGTLGRRLARRWGRDLTKRTRVAEVLDLVDLGDAAQRYPHELSGGEAQRVALARALAPRPELLLLDEPFSNLDAALRASVRQQVRAIIRAAGTSAVFVTHDQEEAFSLADRVAVMQRGRIEQVDRAAQIYRRPATRFVAEFVGDADFLPGRVEQDRLQTEIGDFPTQGLPAESRVDVMFRPEAFELSISEDPDAAEVVDHEYYGHDQMLTLRLASGRRLHVRLGPADSYRLGDRVAPRALGEPMVFRRVEAGEA